MKKYICIHLKDKPLKKCYTCGGITNSCGMYENELGIDPFAREIKKEYKEKYTPKLKLVNGGLT